VTESKGPDQAAPEAATNKAMRDYWDARARENAMWYIHSDLDYRNPDVEAFWSSGAKDLEQTLAPFGLSFRGDERVVEIGCGAGRITRAIASRVHEVVGLDVSAEMVKRAGENLADVSNAKVMLGSGRDLHPLGDAEFDAGYSYIVFQHIPDPLVTANYITELGRVLRPGGWAVFQISELNEIHKRETWAPRITLRMRLASALGRAPRGMLDQSWLGSALPRPDLIAALERGGLHLEETVGDGTQFCLVLARKPEGPSGP
jgi:SAM-dependent methyltransferase